MHSIKVIGANWKQERTALRSIREQVFIVEQGVPADMEWDNLDDQAEHFIAYDGDEAVGCARLIDHKKIGRMAVLKAYRNQDIGRKIIDHIIRFASQKRYTLLQLSAQCHAYEFYRRCGFTACSTPYEDAGIPHLDMECRVFSQSHQQCQYSLTEDTEHYKGSSDIEAKGYLDILLSQSRKKLLLCLNDLSHPLTKYHSLLAKIKFLAKNNRHFRVCVLIAQYHTSNNDHELFKLMARLPSFIEIRVNSEALGNHWIIDNAAWFTTNNTHSNVCFADPAKIKSDTEQFNRWWQNAKAIQSARRLSI